MSQPSGPDLVTEVPLSRWDVELYFDAEEAWQMSSWQTQQTCKHNFLNKVTQPLNKLPEWMDGVGRFLLSLIGDRDAVGWVLSSCGDGQKKGKRKKASEKESREAGKEENKKARKKETKKERKKERKQERKKTRKKERKKAKKASKKTSKKTSKKACKKASKLPTLPTLP